MPDIFQTITGGFFDSVNKDRLYSADQMNMPYKKLISDGLIFEGGASGTVFKVTAAGGMTVNVAPGNALIGGKWAENEDALPLEVSGNTSESTRIDSVILRLDSNPETRAVGVVYRQGDATAPALDTSDGIKEFRLANITVPVNAASITNANIADTRGTPDCPRVESAFEPPTAKFVIEEYTGTQLAGSYQTVKNAVDSIRYSAQAGQPEIALQASDMTQENKVYLYQGSEPDYYAGYLYFYSETAGTWVRGAQYGNVTVDAALSGTSTNPVENKAVKAAIDTEKGNISKVADTVLNLYSLYKFGAFSVGGLNSSTGQANSPSWRCRTDMVETRGRMAVRLNNPAYTLTINLYRVFSNRNTFTGSPTGGYVDASAPIAFECGENDKYFQIAVNRIDQVAMTTDLTDPTSDWSIINNELKVYCVDDARKADPGVFDSIKCKVAKTFPRYVDNNARPYSLQGLCVTDKYIVFSCASKATEAHPDGDDKVNAFYVVDKNTMELAALAANPVIIDFSGGDYPINTSHANSMTYYPDDNEILVREVSAESGYHYMALDADTLAVKRFGTMPVSGGFAYDQTTERWAYLYYTEANVFDIHIYNKDREQLITRLDPKRQGIIQGIAFADDLVFIPASGDKGNSVIVVDTSNQVVASWWFDGGGEFEDMDKLTDNTVVIGANDNGAYKLYVGVYKPFNTYYGNIKTWEDYKNSSIVE